MKKLFNSSGLLIGLILVFIGVLGNRQTINEAIEGAIDRVFSSDNHAEQWRVKPGSIYDGDTLRVIRGTEELKIRFCGMQRERAVRRLRRLAMLRIARARIKATFGR